MKSQKRILFILLGASMAVFSCKKDNTTVKPSLVGCSDTQNFDSITIYNKLIGKWTLELRPCFNSPTALQPVETQRVDFNSNETFKVYNSNSILASGKWGIKKIQENMWGLDLSSPSPLLQGRILYCEDVLVMDSTYVNGTGCSSYFFRTP